MVYAARRQVNQIRERLRFIFTLLQAPNSRYRCIALNKRNLTLIRMKVCTDMQTFTFYFAAYARVSKQEF